MSVSVANAPLDRIRQIQEDGRSGVLSLARNSESVNVFYREGMIEAVSSNSDAYRLGQYLVKAGYLQAAEVEKLLQKSKRQNLLLGEAAVRAKALDAAELANVARHQA